VNSPGPDDDAGGTAGGAGVGVHGAGSCAAGFALAELKMRVNSPGAELGPALAPDPCGEAVGMLELGAGGRLAGIALGIGAFCVGMFDPVGGAFSARGAFIARNIAVKLPGPLPPAGAEAGGIAGGAANGTGSGRFSGVTVGNAGGV
jgi:hypothetical protein